MTGRTHRWALSGRCVGCGVDRVYALGDGCLGRIVAEPAVSETSRSSDANAEGRKDDTGKAPYDLLAPEFLSGTAEILAFGAAKYAPRNWEKGMAWSRPFSAMMRHMWAWWAGEHTDAETGKSHLWHAACCLMFLVAYEQRKTGRDDRPNSA